MDEYLKFWLVKHLAECFPIFLILGGAFLYFVIGMVRIGFYKLFRRRK